MQKAELLRLPRLLQRGLQPQQFPFEHLLVMAAGLLLKKPAPRPAEGYSVVELAVIVDERKVLHPMVVPKGIHLIGSGPPVVMVPLQKILFSGKEGVQKLKIGQSLLQTHPPAQVATEHHRVIGGQPCKARIQFLHIPLPGAAECIHRLVAPQRQVCVSYGVQGHLAASFLLYSSTNVPPRTPCNPVLAFRSGSQKQRISNSKKNTENPTTPANQPPGSFPRCAEYPQRPKIPNHIA